MSTNEVLLVLAIGAVAALIKSTLGMGYPLVLLPVLALFMDVADAVAIVAPSNLLLNGQLMWKMKSSRAEAATLPRFVGGAVLGAIIGAALIPILPDGGLRIALVVIVVLFLINRLSPVTRDVPVERRETLAPVVGGVAGVFQGAAGISGPIVSPWFLSIGIGRDAYIYSIASVFALSGAAQLVVLGLQGSYTWSTLGTSLILIPLAFLVFPIGALVRDRVSHDAFERLVLVLLACSAISLLVKLL